MRNSRITAAKMAAVFVVLTTTVLSSQFATSQVEVVESNPIIRPLGQNSGVVPFNPQAQHESAPNPLDDIFQHIQTLQQQVQIQTGLIEELSYELNRLKQQRLDDYMNLDRRISELGQGGVSQPASRRPEAGSTDPVPDSRGGSNGFNQGAPSSKDETEVYRAANDLISAREWDKAIAALQQYLGDFPTGRYESNAHYWLGELYFVKNDLDSARDAFQTVIENFPKSNKMQASKYKLGRTLFQLGEKTQARVLLEEVASTNSDSSRQAALFLRENF